MLRLANKSVRSRRSPST